MAHLSILNTTFDWVVNDTLSIPLSQSWTNSTVPINVIPKTAAVFDGAALWTDQSRNSFYMWGGQAPYGNLSRTKDLWKFQADGTGGGAWSKEPGVNTLSLVRSKEAGATTCNGAGFFVGGYAYVWTDPDFMDNVPTPGMLTYNTTSGAWANESTIDLNAFGTFMRGTASCLPAFGSRGRGLVLLLGGEVARRDAFGIDRPSFVGFNNVSFWDVGTRTWASQATTGDVPGPRSMFCTVGAAGRNGTHELVIFGGFDGESKTIYEDMYVLSIPGFVWFKLGPTMGGPRINQACALAGDRQMVVVGGQSDADLVRDKDPWPHGIGIFDISTLSWSSGFDAQAEPYESPGIVQDWYNAG